MQVTFSYPCGRKVVAVATAVGSDFIRVATTGLFDGFSLQLRDTDWVTEMGITVRVDEILLGDAGRRFSAADPKLGHSRKSKSVVKTRSRSSSIRRRRRFNHERQLLLPLEPLLPLLQEEPSFRADTAR